MKFVKMNGAGNDYVFVDVTKEEIKNPNAFAVMVSDRNYSVGSDGLVLIDKSAVADCKMEIFNKDGSRAYMCGNAIRCVAKYVVENWTLKNKQEITVETLSGVKKLNVIQKNGIVESVIADMGIPKAKNGVLKTINGKNVTLTEVNVGNPHAVMFVNELDDNVISLLREISGIYEGGINAEACLILDRTNIEMRVWERGSGPTLACGTGATATMYAAYINGLVDNTVRVKLLGGSLEIEYKNEHLFMRGDAKVNFEGEIRLNG